MTSCRYQHGSSAATDVKLAACAHATAKLAMLRLQEERVSCKSASIAASVSIAASYLHCRLPGSNKHFEGRASYHCVALSSCASI